MAWAAADGLVTQGRGYWSGAHRLPHRPTRR